MPANVPTSGVASSDWQSTACILCECNCGVEVQLGGEDGRHLVKVRGDDAHPASKGYACEKAHRLDFYQNGPHRLTKPLRRRGDGSFEEIDWDTAIAEVAARFSAARTSGSIAASTRDGATAAVVRSGVTLECPAGARSLEGAAARASVIVDSPVIPSPSP